MRMRMGYWFLANSCAESGLTLFMQSRRKRRLCFFAIRDPLASHCSVMGAEARFSLSETAISDHENCGVRSTSLSFHKKVFLLVSRNRVCKVLNIKDNNLVLCLI